MKVVLGLFAWMLVGALALDECYQDVSLDCSQASEGLRQDNPALQRCNAKYAEYGRHGNVATELQAYANLHLERSFEYLLSASFFNNYQTNRAGFSKLFKKLSDDTWAKSIDIIKHVTLRGDEMNFAQRSTQKPVERRNFTAEVHELESLAKALDTEKELAERAFYIHREATRNSPHMHDPEIAQYLEEEFIEYQAKNVRDLAGHTSDLKKFITANNGQDLSLALYLFDEYLQKAI
ncbi:ferritin light chain-like isoform X2 [Plodia interpunctella]|uniref:ferritin light chain-like isoform X2 n=1 Tax=Plodia interpunctella TaxID=58824 RepID=UPI002368AEC0|nr:ferritin light chain, oocyte isoform-like isoform X2 [Plodia interpunctella]